MKIIGIDFTSSPSRSKPLTCAVGEMPGHELHVNNVKALTEFSQFESALSAPGPWVAGLDFPFGQSQKLITNLTWPDVWEDYVGVVSRLDRVGFVKLLEDYKEARPPGDKEHRREIDVLASSISPQKLYGVPVGKMFYEGAKRLLVTNADIIPVRRRDSPQVIVEAYPAVVARQFIAKRSYKNDQKAKQTAALMSARQDIVNGFQSNVFLEIYGFTLSLPDDLKSQLIQDATGDTLDAVLCAIQAGWAHMNRDRGYGIPDEASASEGWIADPMFLNYDMAMIHLYRP